MLRFDLSGFGVTIEGLDEPCAAVVRDAWGLFAADVARPALAVRVRFEGDALTPGRIDDAPLEKALEGERAWFRSSEGAIEVDARGVAEAVVGTGHTSMRAFGLFNLILPALAWLLPRHGALILHSGAVLVEGRGFVLIGQAGAGKSTFVAQVEAGGGTVVSEDLNLIVADSNGVSLAGAPLRTRNYPGPGPGRWPLERLLLPRHGPEPELEPVSRLILGGQIQANLPFVGDRWMQVPGGAELSGRLEAVPASRLTFAPDPAFVELLRRPDA